MTTQTDVSAAALTAFAEKLYRFQTSLDPRQQALLLALLARARAAVGDVAGYDLSGPSVTVNNLADLEALMQAIMRGIGCSIHGMMGPIAR